MRRGRFSERRSRGGDALARALLDAGAPLSFDELMAAAPGCRARDVAAWLGHAMAEGLVRETGPEESRELRFALKARGRRLFAARRRAHDSATRAWPHAQSRPARFAR